MVMLKLSHNKSQRLGQGTECWASMLTLTFGTTKTGELNTRKFMYIRTNVLCKLLHTRNLNDHAQREKL